MRYPRALLRSARGERGREVVGGRLDRLGDRHDEAPGKGRFSSEVGKFGAIYQERYWHQRKFETGVRALQLEKYAVTVRRNTRMDFESRGFLQRRCHMFRCKLRAVRKKDSLPHSCGICHAFCAGFALQWRLEGDDPTAWHAVFADDGTVAVRSDARLLRPADPLAIGVEASKARRELGFAPREGLEPFLLDMLGE